MNKFIKDQINLLKPSATLAINEESNRLKKILASKKKTSFDLNNIKEIVDRVGGFNYAKEKIVEFNEQALDAISPYPNSPYKQSMVDLIAFNSHRTG